MGKAMKKAIGITLMAVALGGAAYAVALMARQAKRDAAEKSQQTKTEQLVSRAPDLIKNMPRKDLANEMISSIGKVLGGSPKTSTPSKSDFFAFVTKGTT
ncbi:hypothetical protein [Deinococcus cellulosilyticus]|uniref:Uncharacterized protein n=1 Tax=Deinococcus cellulosilyticus (strain DSM 18568 / NBRC 106333 / KACC 11606 / 5516J-15) TaxID=1223518 RepID=A0A511MYF1_DEIC1|nr:hypothetical protein [Deinococcus cellulosilyticus]GEM45308.1 hypothetical protein DC3_09430 [Deinococcus cellulosilyticus NBRC 106333 = KACC 11606]